MKKREIVVLLVTVMVFVLSGCNTEEGKEFYADGSLKGKGTVQADGKKDGKWKYFYGNGLMMSQGEYSGGEKVGVWKYWNKNGKLIAKRDHGEGEEQGTEMSLEETTTNETPPAHEEKTVVKAPKEEPQKVEPPKEEAKAAETPQPEAHEVASHESQPEQSAPLAVTMEEWKARAAANKH